MSGVFMDTIRYVRRIMMVFVSTLFSLFSLIPATDNSSPAIFENRRTNTYLSSLRHISLLFPSPLFALLSCAITPSCLSFLCRSLSQTISSATSSCTCVHTTSSRKGSKSISSAALLLLLLLLSSELILLRPLLLAPERTV